MRYSGCRLKRETNTRNCVYLLNARNPRYYLNLNIEFVQNIFRFCYFSPLDIRVLTIFVKQLNKFAIRNNKINIFVVVLVTMDYYFVTDNCVLLILSKHSECWDQLEFINCMILLCILYFIANYKIFCYCLYKRLVEFTVSAGFFIAK